MNKLNRAIARYIVKAQIASDAGKGIYDLDPKSRGVSAGPVRLKYGVKALMILSAIKLIRSNKVSHFNYYVEVAGDQNGYPSVLVYFDWRNPVDGERYQISFHNPLGSVGELKKLAGSGRPTHWRKSVNSRETSKKLIEVYDL